AGEDSRHSLVLLVVERGMAGFERGRNLKKLGLDAQDTAELFFEDVKVPKENLLGEPGRGFHYLMEGLAEERLLAACVSAANARHAFDITRQYVGERELFGQPLSMQQNTQFTMAELDTQIDVVQAYLDQCVADHNKNRLTAEMASKAKLAASEIECKMVDAGVQLHGGAGYMEEYEICRMYRDSRVSRIYGGTSEVMKLIIGREIFSEKYRSILA
ncbi:MAG: acyl-CoA dehydrogenase family protein, partial [Pseudomonadota bacterium]